MAEGWTTVAMSGLFGWTVQMADMGPYLGDWPMLASGVIDEIAPGDEDYHYILFVLALPNPAAPTDLAAVCDGSYPTQQFFAWRYFGAAADQDAAPNEEYLAASTGGAPRPSGAEAPPPGYHLYVIADPAPALGPAGYTPARYAALGAAAAYTEAGGWSDWQPGFTVERPALLCTAGGRLMDYPGGIPIAQFQQYASASGADSDDLHTDPTVVGVSPDWPPPYIEVVAFAEQTGWPTLLANLNNPDAQGPPGGQFVRSAWMFTEVYNHYSSLTVPSNSITTWSWFRMMQPRDGWQAQTIPVAPLQTADWVNGRDYADPPYGVYPTYGGHAPPAYDLPGYQATYGIGFPGEPDPFDHEAPKAVPEWVNVEAYLLPNAEAGNPNPEVSIHNAGSVPVGEQHGDTIDVFLGVPPLFTLAGGLEYSIAAESSVENVNTIALAYERGWVDPGASGMRLVDSRPLAWTALGDPVSLDGPGVGSITSPRSVPVAFGELVPYGTELFTILMQAHSTTTGAFNPALVSSLPLPPEEPLAAGVGCQSGPVLMKNYGCYISDPYAPLRTGYDPAGSPTMGIPTLMHEPRWRYWQPNKIVPTELSQIPMRLVQRGDGLGPSPAARLGAGHASASQQSPATRRLAGRNTFE